MENLHTLRCNGGNREALDRSVRGHLHGKRRPLHDNADDQREHAGNQQRGDGRLLRHSKHQQNDDRQKQDRIEVENLVKLINYLGRVFRNIRHAAGMQAEKCVKYDSK